jgi:hypothetical protein
MYISPSLFLSLGGGRRTGEKGVDDIFRFIIFNIEIKIFPIYKMTQIDNIETFEMGEFTCDTGIPVSQQKKPDRPQFSQLPENNKISKPVEKQLIKEIVKNKGKKTDDEISEHQTFVIMLSRYGSSRRFSDYLKSMGFVLNISTLKKMDIEELKELLQRVKTSIDNKNVSNFWEDLTFGLIQTGESLVCATTLSQKIKLAGITEALRGDETFLDLLEQIELENQDITHASPYVRLVYSVVTASMKCHAVNSMMEKRMSMLNARDTLSDKDVQEATLREPTLREPTLREPTLEENKEWDKCEEKEKEKVEKEKEHTQVEKILSFD